MRPELYDNPQKNHARRARINAALGMARGAKGKGGGVVVYLPSMHDLDGQLYQKKGVHRANLIGVERDRSLAKKIANTHRKTVLNGSIFDVIYSWPADFRISIIDADLMCGLTSEVATFLQWFAAAPHMTNTTLCISLSRGRESGAQLRFAKSVAAFAKDKVNNDAVEKALGTSHEKCRAILAMFIMAYGLQRALQEMGIPRWEIDRRGHEWMQKAFTFKVTKPYKSDGAIQYMDTLVVRKNQPFDGFGECFDDWNCMAEQDHSANIRAARAVRTMRMEGTLPIQG